MLTLAAFSLGAPTNHKKVGRALKPDASGDELAGYDLRVGGYGYCCLKAGATPPYTVEDCSGTGADCHMHHEFPGCISWADQCAIMKKDFKAWCDSTEGCGGGFCGTGYPNEGTDEHYCLARSSEEMVLDSQSLNSGVAPTAVTYTKHAAPPPPFGPANEDGILCSGTAGPISQLKFDQMKCAVEDRLFNENGHTLASCQAKCYMNGGCNYFSWKPAGDGVCMGCGNDESIVSHDGFDLYVLHPPCEPPSPPLPPFPSTPPPALPPLPMCDCTAATLRNSETCETFGDPHERTFSGVSYDFMAAGLYTLAKGATECGCDIEVQTFLANPPDFPWAAFNIAAAIKAGPTTYMVKSNLELTVVTDGKEEVHAPLEVPDESSWPPRKYGALQVARFSEIWGDRAVVGYKFSMPGPWNHGAKIIVSRWKPKAGWFADLYKGALPDGYFLAVWVSMPEAYASTSYGRCTKKCEGVPSMPNEECGDDPCLPVFTEDTIFTADALKKLENFTGTGASTRTSKAACASDSSASDSSASNSSKPVTPLEACKAAGVDYLVASEKCNGVASFAQCVYDYCSTGGDDDIVDETNFADEIDEGLRTSPPPMTPPLHPPAAPLPPSGSTVAINIHGDPMFKFNGTGTHFWVKEGALTPLLSWNSANGKKLELLGRTIAAPKSDNQWFKQLLLTQDGKAVVNMAATNPGDKPSVTMKATRGQAHLEPNSLVIITPSEVEVEINGLHLVVKASKAKKFDTVKNQQEYEHLNLHLDRGIPLAVGATGMFAELAGLQPMSAATKSLLTRPGPPAAIEHPKLADVKHEKHAKHEMQVKHDQHAKHDTQAKKIAKRDA